MATSDVTGLAVFTRIEPGDVSGGLRVVNTPRRAFWLWIVLATLTAFHMVVLWPRTQQFIAFAYGDPGCNLTLVALVRRGMRPMVDFGYNYGLVSVVAGDLWTRLAGLTPRSYQFFVLTCQCLLALSIARFTVAVRARASGVALLLVLAPFAMRETYQFAHALEPVLIAAALAEHARGRRGVALAILTLACATKPALAYVYGLVLLVMILRDLWQGRASRAEWVRTLAPAMGCALIGGAILAARYGPDSLARTLLPTAGAAVYRTYHFGFFRGTGRFFWHPPGVRIGYYLGTIAGPWIEATVVLIPAALAAAWRWLRGTKVGADLWRDEVIVACAVVHVIFVTMAFGHAFSWYYYFYVLVLGVVAATGASRAVAWVAWMLVLLALPTLFLYERGAVDEWWAQAPSSTTAGLWASPQERAEWVEARALTRGLRTAVLSHQGGGAEVIAPDLVEATSWLYNKGITSSAEIERKVRQIAGVDAVIMNQYIQGVDAMFDLFPEFRAALAGFERIDVGTHTVVFRRPRAASTLPPAP